MKTPKILTTFLITAMAAAAVHAQAPAQNAPAAQAPGGGTVSLGEGGNHIRLQLWSDTNAGVAH